MVHPGFLSFLLLRSLVDTLVKTIFRFPAVFGVGVAKSGVNVVHREE
ncbi:MAG: hypothetical protein MUC76_12705 [Spirochaetes bacterium]|nr:hypothetical protein [Spirochaetota bacterium]